MEDEAVQQVFDECPNEGSDAHGEGGCCQPQALSVGHDGQLNYQRHPNHRYHPPCCLREELQTIFTKLLLDSVHRHHQDTSTQYTYNLQTVTIIRWAAKVLAFFPY